MCRVTTGINSGVLTAAGGRLYWLLQSGESETDKVPDGAPAGLLSEVELSAWALLKTAKRRQDWLLGRQAAKHLVAEMLHDQINRRVPLDQITILSHPDGWPIVTIPSLGDAAPVVTLSISHSHNRAFCAVIEGKNQPLGADLEANERRSAAFAEEYFTPLENQFLSAVPAEQRDVLTNAIWSGKEAALKAIRRGLAEDTRIVSCLPHPKPAVSPGWLPMRIIWSANRVSRPMPNLVGLWQRDGDHVMTLAYTGIPR